MTMDPHSNTGSYQPENVTGNPAEDSIHAISNLLAWADEPLEDQFDQIDETDNQLIQVSLGIASGLFYSLQAKHFPTASHSLRVAKLCSRWAATLDLEAFQRDQLEVAALLHDVGKIGVPDYVLACPGKLAEEEQTVMDRGQDIGLEILSACCDGEEILDIIRYNAAWYDGTKGSFELKGEEIPLEARMLAIADAFDSMTVDQIFRRARSKDRALAELRSFAGTQFDPELVSHFCELQSRPLPAEARTTRQWLQVLSPEQVNKHWKANQQGANPSKYRRQTPFHDSLVRHIHDAVIYLDINLQILGWNQAAERLTGLTRAAVEGHQWSGEMIGLADQQGRKITPESDPVRMGIAAGTQGMHRLSIRNAAGKFVTVTAHIVPVIGEDGTKLGVTIQMHDTSSVESLEEQIQSLHYKATRDPLTGLVNRAEMDRGLVDMVQRHTTAGRACSLIICDIDFFKKINDTYGHQAGDEALISFASLLQEHARTADLCARYGGEEFVILCPNCKSEDAASLAEKIRSVLAAKPQSALGGKSMTASFGVTELQRGDTADSMLNRADRALLQSKEMGRNIVTQIGGGLKEPAVGDRRSWFSRLFAPKEPEILVKRAMKTKVPLNLAAEKIRGFVADHRAEVVSVSDDSIKVMIDGESLPLQRRVADRAVPLIIDLKFSPITGENGGQHTKVQISIAPRRNRDRRKRDAIERARHLLMSLQSYMVAYEFVDTTVAAEETKPSWWNRLWGPSAKGESR
ncbi:bifunctional diguanylate cyclase/phosphohydrolase [Bremerella sp. T1]|uniref:sensor domain-containing diguanylate cyclase/phosphohydrolase n=1 Tax=Bremerella sp. TYQ1 TaxID=3119568 RepID=UPI001CCDEC4B|nr:diguanylate cyclase [Bremerella volcania]UBM38315.1 diguanylate cyclase [Bremerella volcania]